MKAAAAEPVELPPPVSPERSIRRFLVVVPPDAPHVVPSCVAVEADAGVVDLAADVRREGSHLDLANR